MAGQSARLGTHTPAVREESYSTGHRRADCSDAGKLPGVFQSEIKFLAGEADMKKLFKQDFENYSGRTLRVFALTLNFVVLFIVIAALSAFGICMVNVWVDQ